jgi:two-component system, NarL family, invasion response regulator UvrY
VGVARVLVIDDHPIVLEGCRQLLQNAGIGDVFIANSVASGYRSFRRHNPDVVIIDLALEDKSLAGLDFIRRLGPANSKVGILVFSMYGDPIIVSRALQAGASGYLVKDHAADQLVEAVMTVAAGRPYLAHDMAMKVALLGRRMGYDSFAQLTSRELQTVSLLAKGKSYREIAESLGISYKTVANTTSRLKTILGARTLAELIRLSVVEQLTADRSRSPTQLKKT